MDAIDHLDLVVTSLERSLRLLPRAARAARLRARQRDRRASAASASCTSGASAGWARSACARRSPTPHAVPYDRYGVGLHHLAFAASSTGRRRRARGVAARPRARRSRAAAGVRLHAGLLRGLLLRPRRHQARDRAPVRRGDLVAEVGASARRSASSGNEADAADDPHAFTTDAGHDPPRPRPRHDHAHDHETARPRPRTTATAPATATASSTSRSSAPARACAPSASRSLVLGATAIAQLLVFVASGSVALLADLIHNFGDAATAIPLAIAFALRSARAERWAGLAVVFAIFVSACVAGYEAIDRLLNPHEPEYLVALALAGAIGFAGNWWAAQIRTRAGRRLDSPRSSPTAPTRAPTPTSASRSSPAPPPSRSAPTSPTRSSASAITLVILKITKDSWVTVRAAPGARAQPA